MTNQELKGIFQSQGCLSLESMKLYKQGKLASKNAHLVEKHLLSCALCADAFDSLDVKRMADVDRMASRVNQRLATYMNTPPRMGFFQRFGFAITAGALILAGGGGVALWLNSADKKNPDSASQKSPVLTLAQAGTPAVPNTVSYENPAPAPAPENHLAPAAGPDHAAAPVKKTVAANDPGKKASNPGPSAGDRKPQPTASATNTTPASLPGNSTAGTNTPPATDNTRSAAPQPFNVASARITMKLSAGNGGSSSSGNMSNGQFTRSNKKKKNEQTLDEMPHFPGGDAYLNDYVSRAFRPVPGDRSQIKNFSAMLIVSISSKGQVTKVEVMRGVSREIDEEIVRVFKSMPTWEGGKGDIDATVIVTVE